MTVRYKELAWMVNRTMSQLSQVQTDVSGANGSRKAGLPTPQPGRIATGFVKLKELEAKVKSSRTVSVSIFRELCHWLKTALLLVYGDDLCIRNVVHLQGGPAAVKLRVQNFGDLLCLCH